jgi:hypothetical protein
VAGSTDLGKPGELLGKANAELTDVAATIDWLCDCSNPSIELIEATRAIHGALIALAALGASLNDAAHRAQVMIPRKADASQRFVARPPATCLGSVPISILYDDLLVPMKVISADEPARPASTSGAKSE